MHPFLDAKRQTEKERSGVDLRPHHYGQSAAGILLPLRGQARTVKPEEGADDGHEPSRAESQ